MNPRLTGIYLYMEVKRQLDRSGCIGRNLNVPLQLIAITFPGTSYSAIRRYMRSIHIIQFFREYRFHQNLLEPDGSGSILYAGKILIEPYQQISQKHHMVS